MDVLADRLTYFIPLVLSLSVHEWAHAWAAYRLGDDTAKHLGRLTLNPIAHIDPIGTLLLPLLGVPFGWAKPVPVNPMRFRREYSLGTGMMIVAIAGPISNVVLAVISSVLLGLVARFNPSLLSTSPQVLQVFLLLILMNVLLAVFNMLPVPPLDGSRVADALIPRRWRPVWNQYLQAGPLVLGAVIILPLFLGVNLFAWPMTQVMHLVAWLIAPAGLM